MAKPNNVQAINHVKLQQIKSDSKTMGTTALAKKYGIGYAAAKNAVAAKNLTDFKKRMAEYYALETKNAKARRAAKGQNEKAQAAAAEKAIDNAQKTYSEQEVKNLIDGLLTHTANLEERLQTVVSLLIEADDNVVTRIYRLENKRGAVRRFLEKF